MVGISFSVWGLPFNALNRRPLSRHEGKGLVIIHNVWRGRGGWCYRTGGSGGGGQVKI